MESVSFLLETEKPLQFQGLGIRALMLFTLISQVTFLELVSDKIFFLIFPCDDLYGSIVSLGDLFATGTVSVISAREIDVYL